MYLCERVHGLGCVQRLRTGNELLLPERTGSFIRRDNHPIHPTPITGLLSALTTGFVLHRCRADAIISPLSYLASRR